MCSYPAHVLNFRMIPLVTQEGIEEPPSIVSAYKSCIGLRIGYTASVQNKLPSGCAKGRAREGLFGAMSPVWLGICFDAVERLEKMYCSLG